MDRMGSRLTPFRSFEQAVTIALVALASACAPAPVHWTKAGAAGEEAERDLQECRSRAWREAELPPPRREPPPVIHVSPGPGGAPNVVLAQQAADPFEGWSAEQRRFADGCMRAKGYQLEPRR
ncbi:MAG: hypothetical protein ACT4P4_06500 [Betaproteobacteria bacterium]